MDAVIIGVSDRSILWRNGSVPEKEYERFVADYARLLADHFENLIVTPEEGVYTDVALAWGKLTGKKPIAYYPDKDTFYGYEHLKKNFPLYDVRPIGGDWYTLNADLTKKAPVVICLGFSPGVMIELSYIKYHQSYGAHKDSSLKDIRLLIDEQCIESGLPAGVEEGIKNVEYYDGVEGLGRLV